MSVLSLLGPGDAENLVLMMRGLVTSVLATVVDMVTDPSCSSDTEISIFTALSLTVLSWSPFSWLMFSLLPFSVPIWGPVGERIFFCKEPFTFLTFSPLQSPFVLYANYDLYFDQ